MRHLAALALVALTTALLATGSAPAAEPAAEAPAFKVYHYGSVAEGRAFREVFLVTDVQGPPIPLAEVEIRRNGAPLAVAWNATGRHVQVDDTFEFVAEAFDEKLVLTAHWQGSPVMECRYGGGAGIRMHPREWAALGMPEEVRCLQLSDDQ